MRRAGLFLVMFAAACLPHAVMVPHGFAADAPWPAGVDSVAHARERMRPAMKGTEVPAGMPMSTYSDYTLEFEKWFVRVTSCHEAIGETLRVTRKPAAGRATWRKDAPADLTIVEDAGWFFGVDGDFLFIDAGGCPCPRGLIVYDLAKRQRVLAATYLDHPLEPVLQGRRWLTYLEEVENPVPPPECPDEARWREEGWGDVGYEEEVWFDLRALRKTRSGRVTCSTRQ